MASTSAALVNGLGSAFLTGGKKSQALLSAPVAARAGGAVAPKRLLVVAAAPKKSWIPAVKGGGNLIDPEWLDGSLPGDYGFDPLGLGKDPAFLKWYREAELIHGRWAMAAVVGIFVGQAWSGIPWFEAGAAPTVRWRPSPLAHSSELSSSSWDGLKARDGWISSTPSLSPSSGPPPGRERLRISPMPPVIKATLVANFFDPLGFAGTLKDGVYIPDDEKLERLKLAEIKHARIAMLAMLIFYFEAGQGKTPLGALGL
ncbi:hypothetical protein DH2020_030856 [Rehmannia glutinosa]|uniref:Chlorophyll a-b binding protein, chloroplastic n=1 Tax=Rehmannia glutinosa TaxID=99300 RepID=A0ABR0VN22_REHGL